MKKKAGKKRVSKRGKTRKNNLIDKVAGDKTRLFLLAILVVGLLIRLYFFIGFNRSDVPQYAVEAFWVEKEGLKLPFTIIQTRLMMIYPTVVLYKIFGINNFSISILPLIYDLGNIVLIYLMGRLFFSQRVGLVAALLLAFYPLHVLYSTQLMPDVIIAFFTSLSLYLLFKSDFTDGKNEKTTYLGAKKSEIISFCGGISLGLSYLLREQALIFLLFIGIYCGFNIIIKKRGLRNYVFFMVGAFIIFLGENLFYYLVLGGSIEKFFFYRYDIFFKTAEGSINDDILY
ncbi:MAG: glycosyltransferase family 39 protein, partial [Candidatus Altiarchaeota archaeon]|nr:glycosyltransferase family 39 protein [Candidatus Altiarchaeota archaeon]